MFQFQMLNIKIFSLRVIYILYLLPFLTRELPRTIWESSSAFCGFPSLSTIFSPLENCCFAIFAVVALVMVPVILPVVFIVCLVLGGVGRLLSFTSAKLFLCWGDGDLSTDPLLTENSKALPLFRLTSLVNAQRLSRKLTN